MTLAAMWFAGSVAAADQDAVPDEPADALLVSTADQPSTAPKPKPAPPAPTPAAGADTPSPLPLRRRTSTAERLPAWGLLADRGPSLRLASVPNMLGDFYDQGGQIEVGGPNSNVQAIADLPALGGRRLKVAENNKAVTMDRVYFLYQHFHNALDVDTDTLAPGGERRFSVDRYTIGGERTFLDGLWSVDVRMPFYGDYDLQAAGFGVHGGEIGNLSVALKRMLLVTDTGTLAAGLAIDTPTGSDATAQVTTTAVTIENQAVHLSPFVGFLTLPSECAFVHGFLQLDAPLNGNSVDYADPNLGTGSFGTLTEQALLHVDLSAGYWLFRDPESCGLAGLAAIAEFHYTTTLDDADLIAASLPAGTDFTFGNQFGQIDVTNVTVGLHADVRGRTDVRIASVFPLQDGPERPFDAEIQVSVNRRF